MNLNLKDRCALVTGSSRGIGEAIAKGLAHEGASVIVHGRKEEDARRVAQAITNAGGKAAVALGSLDTDAGASQVADAARAAFGGVDIVVNNAGYAPEDSWDVPDTAVWVDAYNVNVVSSVRLIGLLLPPMKEQNWGRFIQIASVAASSPLPDYGAYGAAKAAIVNLTASLASGLAGTGITSNVVSPGIILSKEIKNWVTLAAHEQQWVGEWPDFERQFTAEFMPNAAGRMGRPEEIADLVAFLASPRADYINGAHYRVDGGRIK